MDEDEDDDDIRRNTSIIYKTALPPLPEDGGGKCL
jgi:hypothetical protein